jgi:2-keto-4-pentenoate hydratase/2-oxohepta-3-ene-1,7-dioic acid hydratase in catechol pathway
MKFVRYDGSRLGLLTDGGVVDLTDPLGLTSDDPLREYVVEGLSADRVADRDPDHAVGDVSLESPLRRPGKIVAAAGNYVEHLGEVGDEFVSPDQRTREDEFRYFLKAPSSVVGPGATVELPFPDRRCDHELELAFVMGEDVTDADPDDVLDRVFGYTVLLDISVRGTEDRSSRKSYDTFTPLGPAVVTPEELGDPHDLEMELRVNGETRQHANTRLMIDSCAAVVAKASVGTTIEAGDVVTTGTPSGVAALADGDSVHAEIEGIGSMSLDVRER